MKNINYFLIDLDGTLVLGEKVLPGAIEFLNFLEKSNKKFLILTNNSSRSTFGYLKHLKKKGFNLKKSHIFTSGAATAMYLLENNIREAFILGTKSTLREFEKMGIKNNPESPNLVVTFDTTINFQKLALATLKLMLKKGIYIASHPDNVCPVENGFIPDVGAIIAFLKEATGAQPDFIPGKPNEYFYKKAMESLAAKKEETAIIGDRISTDIKTGRDFGITSILVLTGETSKEDLKNSPIKPDLVFDNLLELQKFLGG